MRRILWALCFSILVYPAGAQQDPGFSQSMFSTFVYNPGSAGSSDEFSMAAYNRHQWVGLDGAPVSSLFSLHSPFRLFGGDHGAGIHILNDNISDDEISEKTLGINISYAYHVDMYRGKLGIGLSFGAVNSSLEGTWFIPDGDSQQLPSGDPSIPSGEQKGIMYDFGGGIFYYTDMLYLGLSVTHLNEAVLQTESYTRPYFKRNYYLSAGYTINFENPSYRAKPSLLIRSDMITSDIQAGSIIEYKNSVWGGVFYRFGSALVGIAGIELFNGVKIGYSYDLALSSIGRHSKGSHEIVVRYSFEIVTNRSPQRYRSVRIL